MNPNVVSSNVQPQLYYKIMGILFSIHNELGIKFQERYYQRAIVLAISEAKISFKKELMVDLLYRGKNLVKLVNATWTLQ